MKSKKIICFSLLCISSLVFAQENTDFVEEIVEYKESAFGHTEGYLATKSSTGSKMDVDITKIPQSVSVLTKDLIEAQGASSIQQALSYTSAIGQNYGVNGDSRYNFGKLRGNSSLYYSTFLDGLQVLYNVFSIPKQPIYSLERVEILKGPSSSLYGASAPGGLLNLQSKRANFSDEKEVILDYGSYDSYSFGTDINYTIKNDLAVRITSKMKQTKKEISKIENEDYFLNTALKYNINDNTSLDIIAQLANDKFIGSAAASETKRELILNDQIIKNSNYLSSAIGGFASSTQIENAANIAKAANIANDIFMGHDNDKLKRKNIVLGGFLKHYINDDLEFNSNFRINKLSGEYIYSGFDNSLARFGQFIASQNYTLVPYESTKREYELKGLVWDNYINYNWDMKNIKSTSVLGLDLKYQEGIDKGYNSLKYNFNLKNPNYSQNIGEFTGLNKNIKEKLSQIGIYAQNQAIISDKTILTTNLRYDKVKKDSSDFMVATNSDIQKDTNLSGRIGLAYTLDNGVTPYISYASSFVTNSGRNKEGTSYKPSVGKQVEIGAKYYNEDIDSLFTFSAYQIEEDKILTEDPNDSNYSVQVSNSLVKGIEIDATFKPIENLNIITSFSKISAKEEGTTDPSKEGRDLANVPKLGAAFWTDYTIRNTKFGDIKFGTGIKYTGKSVEYITNVFAAGNPEERKELKGYTSVNTLIGSTYKNMDFALNISNVFNKKAKINPTTVSNSFIQGRQFNLSFKYKF